MRKTIITNINLPLIRGLLMQSKCPISEVESVLVFLSDLLSGKFHQHRLDDNAFSISMSDFLSYMTKYKYQKRKHFIFNIMYPSTNFLFNQRDSSNNYTIGWVMEEGFLPLVQNEYILPNYVKYHIERNKLYEEEDKPVMYLDHTHIANYSLEGTQKLLYELSDRGELSIPLTIVINSILKSKNTTLSYHRSDSGRLVSKYGSAFGQNISKKYRNYIFEGQYEYDIVSAAPNILSQLYTKLFGEVLYQVDLFCNNTDLFRNSLIHTGISEKTAKRFFTMLFFGAGEGSIKGLFSEYEWGVISKVDEITSLIYNIHKLFDRLSGYYKKQGKDSGFFTIHKTKISTVKTTRSKLVGAVYLAYESLVLDTIIKDVDISLLLFDAFISHKDLSTERLENRIQTETGFKLNIRKTRLQYINQNKEVE